MLQSFWPLLIKRLLVRSLCAPLFFVPTLFACWHTSSQFETQGQNNWNVKHQMGYSSCRQWFRFRLFLNCLYCLGPALTKHVHMDKKCCKNFSDSCVNLFTIPHLSLPYAAVHYIAITQMLYDLHGPYPICFRVPSKPSGFSATVCSYSNGHLQTQLYRLYTEYECCRIYEAGCKFTLYNRVEYSLRVCCAKMRNTYVLFLKVRIEL